MKGILLKEGLFHATLKRIKTETRRVAKVPTVAKFAFAASIGEWFAYHQGKDLRTKPRYKKGEVVYIKEPYYFDESKNKIYYKYDLPKNSELRKEKGRWKNKMFMPKSAARHYILIEDVKLQRLHQMTNADAKREGVTGSGRFWKIQIDKEYCSTTVLGVFQRAWKAINKKAPYRWEDNPYVWVYRYKLIKHVGFQTIDSDTEHYQTRSMFHVNDTAYMYEPKTKRLVKSDLPF